MEIDHAAGTRHFTFAIPIAAADAQAIATIRAMGPARTGERRRSGEPVGVAQSRDDLPGTASDSGVVFALQGGAAGTTLQWDARRSPAAVVRDATTGEIIAIGMRGQLRLPPSRAKLEILLSDGVRTVTRQFAAPR